MYPHKTSIISSCANFIFLRGRLRREIAYMVRLPQCEKGEYTLSMGIELGK